MTILVLRGEYNVKRSGYAEGGGTGGLLTSPLHAYAATDMMSPASRGRGSVVREARRKGEELGAHRSNRLPWKRIFLESSRRVSQMGPTSS